MFCINSIKSYMKKISQKNYSCEKCSVTLQSKDKNKKRYPFCIKLKIEGMTSPKCKECIENTFNQIEGYFLIVDMDTESALLFTKQQVPQESIIQQMKSVGYRILEMQIMV